MSGRAPGQAAPFEPEPLPPPLREGMAIPLGVKPIPWYGHVRASVLIVVLTLLFGALLYPIVVTVFAQVVTPYTANGHGFRGQNQTNNTSLAAQATGPVALLGAQPILPSSASTAGGSPGRNAPPSAAVGPAVCGAPKSGQPEELAFADVCSTGTAHPSR